MASHKSITLKPILVLSKKKFKSGLESVFVPDPASAPEGRGTGFLSNPFDKQKQADKSSPAKRSLSRKNFTTDLDSLLQEALRESFDEQLEQRQHSAAAQAKPFQNQGRSSKPPFSGLDRLIRRTIESSDMSISEDKPSDGRKRLVVTFEKDKVEKLKKIARLEKAYLKEILSDLVGNFIEEYESKKGKLA